MASDEPAENEEGNVQKPLLHMNINLMHHTRAPASYTSDARPKRIGHISVNQNAVHLWRASLWPTDTLERSMHQPVAGLRPRCLGSVPDAFV